MKITMKKWLCSLCALALLMGLSGVLAAADTAAPAAPAAEQPSAIDLLLERDGYLEGIWYPWFDWWQIGCNLTDNPTMASLLGDVWWKSQEQ